MFFIPIAHAHEAYVLPPQDFHAGLNSPLSWQAWEALQNPHDLTIFIEVTVGVLIALIVYILFIRSSWGKKFFSFFEKLSKFGPIIVRLTIAIAFFAAAYSNSFLGPELPLSNLPYATVLKLLLFVISICIGLGLATEIAAAIGIGIFALSTTIFGAYLATYLNYAGELVALLLYGSRYWSVDRILFGHLKRLRQWHAYESVIVRVFYGLALMYAAVTVKLLHPALTLEVVNIYNLTQFHWLFPSDPLLVTLGAALAELAIGLFIMIGFATRLTVVISLFYITLSLLFFKEAVWPHLLLYGISLNLLVTKPRFSIDSWLTRNKQ